MGETFQIKKRDNQSQARLGRLKTRHGAINTPAFLPIGSRGSVKAVTVAELKFWGAEIILANTYHLWMRPGDLLIKKHGGLHKFMGWDGVIMTDSGGFQVFSLGEKTSRMNADGPLRDTPIGADRAGGYGRVLEVTNGGVTFKSDLDGQVYELTPEQSVQIQANLGSDIGLVLDFFPGYPFEAARVKRSVELTLDWAERSQRAASDSQTLFGIVQGGNVPEWRKQCAEGLRELNFPGYGIGGVAVGEPEAVMYEAVRMTVPYLEEDKPRHLLGVGTPEQLVKAVALGCDMFDCVLPTRNARHGALYINRKEGGYTILRITNEQYKEDFTPVDNTCGCYLCTKHSRAYLRHLFLNNDPLALRLATMHNLRFYLDLMARIRRGLEYGSFAEMAETYQEY